jgi:hypothetical protein
MRVAICASMAFSERMIAVQQELERMGHETEISRFAALYAGKSPVEKERLTLHDKNESDAIREFWEKIRRSDAILVLNYDRKGVKNYVGGNTLMEIGFAHVLHRRIFLLNDIPDIDFYKSEIEACKPIILDGDLAKIV